MKLALGTAQFGLAYGVTNPAGQVAEPEVQRVLNWACLQGIDLLDTAPAYGDSETVLGRCGAATLGYRLVTKALPLAARVTPAQVIRTLEQSFTTLGTSVLYGILLHHATDLFTPGGEAIYAYLQTLKRQQRVARIGVSVYGVDELARVCDHFDVDLVQLPLNVLDQRMATSGWLKTLNARGIEVHARSLLLQGLLAEPAAVPARFARWREAFERLSTCCRASGLSALALALCYVRQLALVDYAVMGTLSCAQLAQCVAACHTPIPSLDWAALAVDDECLLNPSYWAMLPDKGGTV